MAVHSRRIGGSLAFWETHRHRIIDGFGVNVLKYFEDFESVPIASDAIDGWTTTLVEMGCGESTVARTDLPGGAILITTDDAENDGVNLQLAGESFSMAATNQLYFGIRFQASEATNSDIFVGLSVTDTDALGGVDTACYFEKLDAAATINTVTEKDTTETTTSAVATFVVDTWTIWEFFYDGTSVYFYIDGTLEATHTLNIPNDEEMTPTIHFLTGAMAAETMTVDWVRCIEFNRNAA